MARVPGVAEVGGLGCARGPAVALSAQFIDGVSGVASGVLGNEARGVAHMIGGGGMAGLAAHAELVGYDRVSLAQLQFNGPVEWPAKQRMMPADGSNVG